MAPRPPLQVSHCVTQTQADVRRIPAYLGAGLILALLFLPLASSALALIAGGAGLYLVRRGGAIPQLPGLGGALQLLALVFVAGIAFSMDVWRSLQGVGKVLPALFFLYVWLLAMRAGWLADGQAVRRAALVSVLVAVTLFVASEIIHGGFIRRDGGLVSIAIRNPLAVSLLLALAAMLACWTAGRGLHWLLLATLTLGAIFTNDARGAMVAGVVILALALLLRMGLRPQLIVIIGLLTAAAVGTLFQVLGVPDMLSRPGDFLSGRGVLWHAAVQVIADHPLFGIGINTWKYSAYVHALSGIFIHQPSPHNLILDLLTSIGIVGCLLLGIAIVRFCRIVAGYRLPISAEAFWLGVFLLTAYTINSTVDFRVFSVQSIVIWGAALALVASKPANPASAPSLSPRRPPP